MFDVILKRMYDGILKLPGTVCSSIYMVLVGLCITGVSKNHTWYVWM